MFFDAMNETKPENQTCMPGQGTLPPCGPFAVPFVASQGKNPERYSRAKALEAGTLFPALDLPFFLKVNPGKVEDTHLNQLRALDFVLLELGLYLDTHPYDREAFGLFQEYAKLEKAAREAYVQQHGPLVQSDAAMDDNYTWGKGPWPWQYPEEEA